MAASLSGHPPSSPSTKREIYALIEKYLARREATNSARNAKPLFTNIEKEQRDLAIRQRHFKADIKKAMEKLGDMSMFQKYLKARKPPKPRSVLVEVQPYSITVVKASATPSTANPQKKSLFLTCTGADEDLSSTRRYRSAQPTSRRPQTTKSGGYKSTPMHLDPKYKFKLKRRVTERVDMSSQLSIRLDDVMNRCGEVAESFTETKRLESDLHNTQTHFRHRSLADISDMLESLKVEDEAEDFETSMLRKRTARYIDRQVLATAGEVKRSYLDSSEFVAKHAHKGIWRYSTLSMTRHVDKLINSLPVSRGLVR